MTDIFLAAIDDHNFAVLTNCQYKDDVEQMLRPESVDDSRTQEERQHLQAHVRGSTTLRAAQLVPDTAT